MCTCPYIAFLSIFCTVNDRDEHLSLCTGTFSQISSFPVFVSVCVSSVADTVANRYPRHFWRAAVTYWYTWAFWKVFANLIFLLEFFLTNFFPWPVDPFMGKRRPRTQGCLQMPQFRDWHARLCLGISTVSLCRCASILGIGDCL